MTKKAKHKGSGKRASQSASKGASKGAPKGTSKGTSNAPAKHAKAVSQPKPGSAPEQEAAVLPAAASPEERTTVPLEEPMAVPPQEESAPTQEAAAADSAEPAPAVSMLQKAGNTAAELSRRAAAALGPLLKRAGKACLRLLKLFGKAALRLLKYIGRWLRENFSVKPAEAGRIALDGLLRRNPVFVLLLGLCPTLAVTTTLQNGLAMGLVTAAVLVCSNLTVSLLRTVLLREIRTLSWVMLIAVFVTAADLLLQAFAPGVSDALGLYVPLIAVNSLLLGRAEAFACSSKPGASLLDGLFMGLGFTAALSILGAIRELLGAGAIWGAAVPVLKDYPVNLVLSPCGGFLLLGCLLALAQWLRTRFGKGGEKT